MPESIKLHVFLSRHGVASRRKAESLISTGHVSVNGKKVTTLGVRIDPEKDHVAVDGDVIQKIIKKRYVIFNKPLGVTTTLSDPHAEKTLAPFLSQFKERLVPVGRLDRDSTGLLLLTNDGALAFQLMHPKFQIEKQYRVVVAPSIATAKLKQIERGIVIEGKKTAPCQIRVIKEDQKLQILEFVLREGRKREIRHMVQWAGAKVRDLCRLRLGPLELKSLKEGQFRELSREEVASLQDWTRQAIMVK